jgi:alpha-mannosidase
MVFEIERIERITKDLQRAMYADSETISAYKVLEGCRDKAAALDLDDSGWREYRDGELWGGYDKHQWFRTSITIPERFAGKNVIFRTTTGREGEWDALNPQFLLYIDGRLVQGLDVNHREAVISDCAESGRTYSIAMLAYSGLHEAMIMLHTELCVLDKAIEGLYYNLMVPVSAAKLLDELDENRVRTLSKLGRAADMLDMRKLYSEGFYSSVAEANEYLKKEFYSEINNNSPVVTAVGHTHIDVAWLWTIRQTKEKTARSFSTVLRLMEQYPEYRFMSSQPQLYEYIKENQPGMYEEIKARIKEGRWEADGAMWLEADCNIPSGESLVRQILFGKRFFREEFDVESRALWLPDVFGYSAALPQIMKKSGIDYFMTTKISWNQFNMMPNDTFLWRGIDGSEVLTYFVTTCNYNKAQGENITFSDRFSKTTYTGLINANQVLGTWKRYQNKDINEETMMLFGYGDGGGGPTKEMLENARRLEYGIPGLPRLQIGSHSSFLDRLYERVINNKELPGWVGELYLEYHRGTYTSMARNKRYNRKCEFLYQDAELLSVMSMLMGDAYPENELKQGWKTMLLNQFHDIIPGSSIKEVYDESHKQYEELLESGQGLVKTAISKISSRIDLKRQSVIVFNTLSHDRDDLVEMDIPEGMQIYGLQDDEGKAVDIQRSECGSKLLFFAGKVPAKGYKVFSLTDKVKEIQDEKAYGERVMENVFFRLCFDEAYNITSLFDKENHREVLKSGERANVLQAFEDRPMNWENWDIDIYYKRKMWEVNDLVSAEVIERGPVRSCIRLERCFCDSRIEQYIYMYKDIPRIDFKNHVDWKEKNILLKVAFPVAVNASRATYEIQYGNVERETHNNTSWDIAKFEVCAHKWADLSEGAYGVSLLNDCKYGYDIKNGVMRLTLIKSGTYPNPEADLGEHEFTYSLYPHKNTWREADTAVMAYNLNVPMHAVLEAAHQGPLSSTYSLLSINRGNCVVEAVKKAEDGEGVIVRLYEYKNMRENIEMNFSKEIEACYECDLMEGNEKPAEVHNNCVSFEILPYEIKTFKVYFKQVI